MGMILPLFKGKGLKACEKDNYRGITMFPVIIKVFEVILLRRLENFAKEKGYFSHLQFGFSAGSGCSEASFVIMEAINHIKEREGKVFACFLDVRKAFDTVWIDGLLYKLFSELGVKGKMFAMIKALYTDVDMLYFNGVSTQAFPLYQGSGQGRILAPFMSKVYINRLIETVYNSKCALVIDELRIRSPAFAGDMTLLSLFPSFLWHLMQEVTQYSKIWRYDYNQSKSGVVVFGEPRAQHYREKQTRHWELDGNVVTELDEYKNLDVVKNYTSSSRLDISKAIEKARKKAGMLLNGCTDRRKTNPTIYIKLWRKVCLPTLLHGAELWTLNPSLLIDLERCQVWFLKKVLHFPKFAHNLFVLKICNMHSIQSEIDYRKLLKKRGNLISEVFKCRVKSYFVDIACFIGFIKEVVVQLLNKYDLSHHFNDWYHTGFFALQ